MSKASDKDNEKQKVQQDATKDLGKRSEGWGTLDVLGQPAEPICTYYGLSSQDFTPWFTEL